MATAEGLRLMDRVAQSRRHADYTPGSGRCGCWKTKRSGELTKARCARRNKGVNTCDICHVTREKVIQEFRRVGRVDLACAAAGVDRTTHYGWMKNDPEYRKSFEEAREEA